jgi:hypothetical protein
LRICVDVSRPSQLDRSKGKVPPGLYLRDIGEVREGANAYDFIHNTEPPELDDQCLSLIGTERTICLQLPSKVSIPLLHSSLNFPDSFPEIGSSKDFNWSSMTS